MKRIAVILLACVAFAGGDEKPKHNDRPADGYVPNKDVAIKIAVAVWEPIYGADQVAGEKPYRATLSEGVWTVEGTLPEGSKGGVAVAEISKKDGRILRVSHGK